MKKVRITITEKNDTIYAYMSENRDGSFLIHITVYDKRIGHGVCSDKWASLSNSEDMALAIRYHFKSVYEGDDGYEWVVNHMSDAQYERFINTPSMAQFCDMAEHMINPKLVEYNNLKKAVGHTKMPRGSGKRMETLRKWIGAKQKAIEKMGLTARVTWIGIPHIKITF